MHDPSIGRRLGAVMRLRTRWSVTLSLWLAGGAVITMALLGGGMLAARSWIAASTLVDNPVAAPDTVGIDAVLLDRMADRLMAQQTDALLVARRGVMVLERYGSNRFFHLPPASRRRAGASITKGLLAGSILAIGSCEGWLDLDDPVGGYLKGWNEAGPPPAVTLRHLADHTAGLAEAERELVPSAPQPDWGVRYWRNRALRAQLALAVAPQSGEPGRRVSYSNPGYTVLAMSVAEALARHDATLDIRAVVEARLMRPLGIPPRAWTIGEPRAIPGSEIKYYELGSGARLTGRALLRLGELIAADGRWNDRQLIDRDCLSRVTTPVPGLAPNAKWSPNQPAAAGDWWTNAQEIWPELPRDLLIAAGAEHRVVVVAPSLDLVAVRLGRRLSFDGFADEFWQRLRTDLLQPLVAAVRELPEAPVPTAIGTPSVRGG